MVNKRSIIIMKNQMEIGPAARERIIWVRREVLNAFLAPGRFFALKCFSPEIMEGASIVNESGKRHRWRLMPPGLAMTKSAVAHFNPPAA